MRFPQVVRAVLAAGEARNAPGGPCGYGRVCNMCIYETVPGTTLAASVSWAEETFMFYGPEAADIALSLVLSEEAAK